MLAMFDFGNLIGRPLLGQSVGWFDALGWDGYRMMFVTVACLLAGIAVAFAVTDHPEINRARPEPRASLRSGGDSGMAQPRVT